MHPFSSHQCFSPCGLSGLEFFVSHPQCHQHLVSVDPLMHGIVTEFSKDSWTKNISFPFKHHKTYICCHKLPCHRKVHEKSRVWVTGFY